MGSMGSMGPLGLRVMSAALCAALLFACDYVDLEDVLQDPGSGPADPADPIPAINPSVDGPFGLLGAVSAEVVREDRTIPVLAYLPERPAGEVSPVVLLSPGFQLSSWRYEALAEYVAQHGFAVVLADPPAGLLSVSHVAMAADLSAVLDWALSATGPIADHVDLEGPVALMGHSLGGKVSVMTASADPRVSALFALDPVNGGNPLSGYTAELPDIVPDLMTDLAIPMGFVGEATNADNGLVPCAPADQNFQTFFEAAESSPWAASWDIPGADHMDFVFDTGACLVCTQCPDGGADEAAVRAVTKTLAVAFLRRHLLGEGAQDTWLVGSLVPSKIGVLHKP